MKEENIIFQYQVKSKTTIGTRYYYFYAKTDIENYLNNKNIKYVRYAKDTALNKQQKRILELFKENKKLQTNWKELKNWLEEEIYSIEPKGTAIYYNCEYDSEEDYINAMKERSKLITLKRVLIISQEIEGGRMNRSDFIKSNGELDYVMFCSYLQQENQQLKEELEKLKQPQIFIDTGDMEERYGEQLYQDYLKEQLDLYKSVIDEVIREINSATILNADNEHWLGKADVEYLLEILDKAKESK